LEQVEVGRLLRGNAFETGSEHFREQAGWSVEIGVPTGQIYGGDKRDDLLAVKPDGELVAGEFYDLPHYFGVSHRIILLHTRAAGANSEFGLERRGILRHDEVAAGLNAVRRTNLSGKM
jgi:hypothetical protein